jgi:hypothetical protein
MTTLQGRSTPSSGSACSAVGERRVARFEDQVGLALDAQLLAQRRPHIDLAEHAEPFGPQFGAHRSTATANGNGVAAFSV